MTQDDLDTPMQNNNIIEVVTSNYGTHIVQYDGRRVWEESSKLRANTIADFLRGLRAVGPNADLTLLLVRIMVQHKRIKGII